MNDSDIQQDFLQLPKHGEILYQFQMIQAAKAFRRRLYRLREILDGDAGEIARRCNLHLDGNTVRVVYNHPPIKVFPPC